jgi:hypothetical protein
MHEHARLGEVGREHVAKNPVERGTTRRIRGHAEVPAHVPLGKS